jgi:hypothetical protein
LGWAAVLGAMLIAAGSAAGWRRVRPFVEQQAYLRRQRQCMGYVAPPADSVAYEEVPDRREELLRTGRYRLPATLSTNLPPQQAEWYPYETLAPAPWRSLGLGMSGYGVAFLHARTSGAGLERLVAVVPSANFAEVPELGRGAVGHRVSLTGLTYVPAGRQIGARIGKPVGLHSITILLSPSQRFRLYTGEADPADPAHFTMKYDVDGVLGTIDGRLLDRVHDWMNRGGEGVELTVRDGPALAGRPRPPGWDDLLGLSDVARSSLLLLKFGYSAFPDPRDRLRGLHREQVEAWGPAPVAP